MPSSDASGTIEIAADPEWVYALITTSVRWTKGATSAQVGTTLRCTNRNGLRRWSTSSTVAALIRAAASPSR